MSGELIAVRDGDRIRHPDGRGYSDVVSDDAIRTHISDCEEKLYAATKCGQFADVRSRLVALEFAWATLALRATEREARATEREAISVVEFRDRIEERLGEWQQLAEAATPGPWRIDPEKEWRLPGSPDGYEFITNGDVGVAVTGLSGDPQSKTDALFIAVFDPVMVLALVAGLRDVLGEHPKHPRGVESVSCYTCRQLAAACGLDAP